MQLSIAPAESERSFYRERNNLLLARNIVARGERNVFHRRLVIITARWFLTVDEVADAVLNTAEMIC